MLCGNAAEQGGRPRSCGCHSARQQHRPAPRDSLPTLLNRPVQESFFSPYCFVNFVSTYNESTLVRKTQKRKTTHAQRGHIRHVGGSPA
jgi:hypothetical protein